MSWTRVEIRTPKYSTAKSTTAQTTFQAQIGSGSISYSAINVSWTYPPISTPRPVVSTIVPA